MRHAWVIPNLLTGLRLILLPVFIHLLARTPVAGPEAASFPRERAWAVLVLLIMGVTDALDGWTARRLQATSRVGSLADAVADRLVLLVPLLFVALVRPAGVTAVPIWLPLWLMGLDAIGGAAWLIARQRRAADIPAEHNLPGRVATWILFALLLWTVVGLPERGVVLLGTAGLGLATVSSVLYLRRWWGPDLDGRSAAG